MMGSGHPAKSKICSVAALVISDADRFINPGDEDLSIADLAGAGGGEDRLDHRVFHFVGHDHLQLDFG